MQDKIYISEGLYKDRPHLLKKLKRDFDIVHKYDNDIIGMILDDKYIDIDKYSNLKVISRCGIGLDNVNMEECNKRNILIYNIPDIPTIPVANYTIKLMKDILKKVSPQDTLKNRTVGIIGCGRIGTKVIRILDTLNVKYYYHDLIYNTSLIDVIRKSNIITIHIPLYNLTRHMIDDKLISNMNEKTILINTARGELIDEDSVHNALVDNYISGFASDVNNESKFKDVENVIITPHIATFYGNIREELEKIAIENLLDGLKNKNVETEPF